MSILDYSVRIVCKSVPREYYRELQTDVLDDTITCPSHPGTPVSDFAIEKTENTVPTSVAASLQITTNIGTAVVNDIHNVTADPTNTKYVRISAIRDDGTNALEVLAEEKVLGEYGGVPGGKTLEVIINEFFVVAAGTDLVEL